MIETGQVCVYVGKDLNFRNMKCIILGKVITLVRINDLLIL